MKTKAIIVDIDGTLAILNHRLHHVKNPEGKKNFDKFFAEAHKDTPKQNVIDIVSSLSNDHVVIFLTGRPEKLREVTLKWLQTYVPINLERSIDYNLTMRPDGDYTPDDELKQSMYEELVKPKFDVVGIFDDRQRVVNMWRRIGLTCFQVDQWEES